MTDTNTAFPNFAPGEDRELLADVHRWARTNGWNWHEAWGWVNAHYVSDATLAVEWEDGPLVIRSGEVLLLLKPKTYPVASVREAVDILVALRILPAHFSSAYEAGVIAGNIGVGPLLAAVARVIAAGQLDWDSGADVEGIQGRAHTALVEAYQQVTR